METNIPQPRMDCAIHILMVNDSLAFLEAIRDLFNRLVACAESGQKAMAQLVQNRPTLVNTNGSMPRMHRMYELETSTMRWLLPQVELIMGSSQQDSPILTKVSHDGAEYVSRQKKPEYSKVI